MADRLELYDVTVPAGTTKAAPLRTNLPFDPGYLRKWQVVMANGMAGLVGFHLDYAGQQLIPNTPGTWITGNDERIDDTVTYHFVGNQWVITAYNADVWDHTLHIRLYVDDLATVDAPVTVIPDVLPVTVNAGTVDVTPLAAPDVTTGGDVTPLDVPDVTPLVIPADTTDVPADVTATDTTAPTDAAPVDTTPALPDDGTTP